MLRLSQVVKRFGDQIVLDHLDLELPLSGVTFVMGPSGAGKSVLAQVATGLLPLDSGQLSLEGRDLSHLSERHWRPLRSELAYLAQGPALLDWLSLLDNIVLALRHTRSLPRTEAVALARHALDRVGLAASADQRPSQVGPGVQKRAAVARALACRPRVLFYDEPTTGLDPRSARQVDDLIVQAARDERERVAAVVVSHDLVSAERIAERVVVLHRGRAGFDGTYAKLLQSKDSEPVRALLGDVATSIEPARPEMD
jgi:phospholipid/cholesterol/gamma-HCH transport system ATP-binding protein